MNTHFSIKNDTVHLWRVLLPDFFHEEHTLLGILNDQEVRRALRLRFPIHRQRFITARALLRKILSLYIDTPPEKIKFSYGPHGKPYLENNPLQLQFNVSHSHDMAIYALTHQNEIGVDIEKIAADFNPAIAKRFFSLQEYTELMALPESERLSAFYRIWSRKEAVIKALGENLFFTLANFSVSAQISAKNVTLSHLNKEHHFHVENFFAHPNYQAAFATEKQVIHIINRQWQVNFANMPYNPLD